MNSTNNLKTILIIIFLLTFGLIMQSQTKDQSAFWKKIDTKIIYNAKNSLHWGVQNNKVPFSKYLKNPVTDIMAISNGTMIVSPLRGEYIVSNDEGKTWSPVERNNKNGGVIDIPALFTISYSKDFFILHNYAFHLSSYEKKSRKKPYLIYISYDGKKWEKASSKFIPEHFYYTKNGSLAKVRNTEVIDYLLRKGWDNNNHRVIHHLYDNSVTIDTLNLAYQRIPSGGVQLPLKQSRNTSPAFLKYLLNPCNDEYYEVGTKSKQPVHSHKDLNQFMPYDFNYRKDAVGIISLKPIGNLRMGTFRLRQKTGKADNYFGIKKIGESDWIHLGREISKVTYNPKTKYLYGILITRNGFNSTASFYRSSQPIDSNCSKE